VVLGHGRLVDARIDVGDATVCLPLQSSFRVASAIEPWLRAINVDALSNTSSAASLRDRRLLNDVFTVRNDSGVTLKFLTQAVGAGQGGMATLRDGEALQLRSDAAKHLAVEAEPGRYAKIIPSAARGNGSTNTSSGLPADLLSPTAEKSPASIIDNATEAASSTAAAAMSGDVVVLVDVSVADLSGVAATTDGAKTSWSFGGDRTGPAVPELHSRVPLRVAYSFAERTVHVTSLLSFEARCPNYEVELHSCTYLDLRTPSPEDIDSVSLAKGGTVLKALVSPSTMDSAAGGTPASVAAGSSQLQQQSGRLGNNRTTKFFIPYGDVMANGLSVAVRPMFANNTTTTTGGDGTASPGRAQSIPRAEYVNADATIPGARSVASLAATLQQLLKDTMPDAGRTRSGSGSSNKRRAQSVDTVVEVAVPLVRRGAQESPSATSQALSGRLWMRCKGTWLPILNPVSLETLTAAAAAAETSGKGGKKDVPVVPCANYALLLTCVFEPVFTIRSLLPAAAGICVVSIAFPEAVDANDKQSALTTNAAVTREAAAEDEDDDDGTEAYFEIAGAGLPEAVVGAHNRNGQVVAGGGNNNGASPSSPARRATPASPALLKQLTRDHARRARHSARHAISIFTHAQHSLAVTTIAAYPLENNTSTFIEGELVRQSRPSPLPAMRPVSTAFRVVSAAEAPTAKINANTAPATASNTAVSSRFMVLTLVDAIGGMVDVACDVNLTDHLVTLRPLALFINRLPAPVRLHADQGSTPDAMPNENRNVVGGLTSRRTIGPNMALLVSPSNLAPPGLSLSVDVYDSRERHTRTYIAAAAPTCRDAEKALTLDGVVVYADTSMRATSQSKTSRPVLPRARTGRSSR
jgi:hypothetical protein